MYIDISIPITKDIPHWPTDKPPVIEKVSSFENGDAVNVTTINMNAHTGTHIDAPLHFVPGGKGIDELETEKLIGACYVCDMGDVDIIDSQVLEKCPIPKDIKRILFKTKNKGLWGKKEFVEDYTALIPDGAEWIVDHGIELVGIDYLSIEPYSDDIGSTHKILLDSEIIIVEGLNLEHVEEGLYELIVLPISIKGADGAPARALLKPRA